MSNALRFNTSDGRTFLLIILQEFEDGWFNCVYSSDGRTCRVSNRYLHLPYSTFCGRIVWRGTASLSELP